MGRIIHKFKYNIKVRLKVLFLEIAIIIALTAIAFQVLGNFSILLL